MAGSPRTRVCVVDDEPAHRGLVARWLVAEGCSVREYPGGPDLLREFLAGGVFPDAIVLDQRMPRMEGVEVLDRLRRLGARVPAIVLTAVEDVPTAVACMRAGARDYLVKPVERGHLLASLERALAPLEHTPPSRSAPAPGGIVGSSPALAEVLRHVERVARSDIPVLIEGETGTGKELVAARVHARSRRASGPFVAVNCAAIPEGVQESELFGHERGAFTGAAERRRGCFQRADGGTLFLDEVGELSPAAQARLLRALQEKVVDPVGADRPVPVDARVVSATHVPLRARVAAGTFRADLYYRLAGYPLPVPPLRERLEDVGELVEAFLARHGGDCMVPPRGVSAEASATLRAWPWPGNVRELENAVRHALLRTEDGQIREEHLPDAVRRLSGPPVAAGGSAPATDVPDTGRAPDLALARLQDHAVRAALAREGGHVGRAARRLGIGRATLYRWLAASR